MSEEHKISGWQRVFLIIIPYVFIVGAFQFMGKIIIGGDLVNLENSHETLLQKLILTLFSLLGTFFVLWIFVRFIDKDKFINLGFHIKNRRKDFGLGFLLGLLIMGLGYFILLFSGEIIFEKFNIDLSKIAITFLLFILVAINEEVLFRGYFIKNLMLSFNKYIAVFISAILFSLAHGFNPHIDELSLVTLFLFGVIFGISYIYTNNLWFPIALHFSWNFFQSILGFNVSGQDFYFLVETKFTKANILNGGFFGFEGSILCVMALLITIVVMLIYYSKKSKTTI